GILQRDDGVSAPSRHLGLVPAAERADAAAALDLLAAQVADRIDLEAIVRLAKSAPPLDGTRWDPEVSMVEVRAPWREPRNPVMPAQTSPGVEATASAAAPQPPSAR